MTSIPSSLYGTITSIKILKCNNLFPGKTIQCPREVELYCCSFYWTTRGHQNLPSVRCSFHSLAVKVIWSPGHWVHFRDQHFIKNKKHSHSPCVWLPARRPPVSAAPRVSFPPTQRLNIHLDRTHSAQLRLRWCCSVVWCTLRKTPITASPLSSITASSNKLYLSEFQWTMWSWEHTHRT